MYCMHALQQANNIQCMQLLCYVYFEIKTAILVTLRTFYRFVLCQKNRQSHRKIEVAENKRTMRHCYRHI